MNDEDKIKATLRKIDRVKLEPIPEYGDLIPLDYFIEDCVEGHFTIQDGIGYYATSEGYSENDKVYPSDVKKGIVDKSWTHVMWFNK